MHRRRWIGVVGIVVVLSAARPATADDVTEIMDRARAAYRRGDLTTTIRDLGAARRQVLELRTKLAEMRVNARLRLADIRGHEDRYVGQTVRWEGEILDVETGKPQAPIWLWIRGEGVARVVFPEQEPGEFRRGDRVEVIGKVVGEQEGVTGLEALLVKKS